MNLKYNPDSQFKPDYFFNEFNTQIPKKASKNKVPTAKQLIQYKKVEESEKIYFFRWRNNIARNEHVSKENLAKTSLLMGYQAYKICKDRNISTEWTDDKRKAKNQTYLILAKKVFCMTFL